MLDPVVNFFTMVFQRMGQGIGWLIALVLWPFVAFTAWVRKRGWIIKGSVAALLLVILAGYGYFIYATQVWHGYDPDYAKKYAVGSQVALSAGAVSPVIADTSATGADGATVGNPDEPDTQAQSDTQPGAPAPAIGGTQCVPSRMVQASVDLLDFNVNQNNWVPSMFLSKLGFFGVEWKNTPFMDNKAAFQLGVNQALRRVSVELVDRLGRVRGTSSIDQNLQDARQSLAYDEDSWYFSFDPFGPRSTTQANYRRAARSLDLFNEALSKCSSNFDARPDNLLQFLDRVTSDIGSTSDILRSRMEASNLGWFDPRADDRFWFAYGQLYAYYGIMTAVRADFSEVFANRNLEQIWVRTEEQFRSALNMTPAIISNGGEASWIMPTHLATMGFYVLRVRSNLIELRDVLDR
ncbi:MAG: DUF2333 family protein [Pseudomonadota bacterium]